MSQRPLSQSQAYPSALFIRQHSNRHQKKRKCPKSRVAIKPIRVLQKSDGFESQPKKHTNVPMFLVPSNRISNSTYTAFKWPSKKPQMSQVPKSRPQFHASYNHHNRHNHRHQKNHQCPKSRMSPDSNFSRHRPPNHVQYTRYSRKPNQSTHLHLARNRKEIQNARLSKPCTQHRPTARRKLCRRTRHGTNHRRHRRSQRSSRRRL